MGRFVVGDLVVVPFQLSSTTGEKRRPAIVLASWNCEGTSDYLLCMVTSQETDDPYAFALVDDNLIEGSLHRRSFVRPLYLFAVGEYRILRKAGTVGAPLIMKLLRTIQSVLDSTELMEAESP